MTQVARLEPRAPAGFRTLPENVEAEAALLGGIMIDNAAYQQVSFLTPDHFYEPLHGGSSRRWRG